MNKTVRFAIYGCGMIANVHADALLQIDNATLCAVADVNTEFAQKFAAKYGVKVLSNFDAILNDETIDAVCITTPNGTHAELAIRALEHNKSVILEKPMAITTKLCDDVIEACKHSNGVLSVISQLRTSPDIIKAKKIVESGVLGTIVLCDLYMKYYRSPEYFVGTWKGTKKMDGGGALMNQGIHGVDLLQYIAGPIVNIKSISKTLVHDIEVEDTSVSVLEFESGAIGVIEAATSVYPGCDRRIEINGSKGSMTIREDKIESLIIDGQQSVAEEIEASGTSSDPTKVDSLGHKRQIENFVNAVLGNEQLWIDEHEGRKAVDIIERIYTDSLG